MDSKLIVENNLIDGPNDWADGANQTTNGLNPITGPPEFIDAAMADFRLQPTSPAIDAGSPAGAPLTDYAGVLRPQDGNGDSLAVVDIGAYEYQRSTAVPPEIWTKF